MKKIVIVNNGTLPLPAVKGGAVETLIDLLVNENEKRGCFHFEVYSIFDEEAMNASRKYSYSTFHFVKIGGFRYKMKHLFTRILNAFCNRLGGYYHSYPLHKQIVNDVNKNPCEYAAILLEGCGLDACFLKKKTGLPIIQRIHNVPFRPMRKFDKQSAQCTDLYLGISKYICDVLKKEEGNYCSNIELLYNSIPFERFNREVKEKEILELRNKLGFDKSDFIIMFSGRLREYKGVKELLMAIEKCKEYSSIKLLVVGSHIFSSNQKTDFIESLTPIVERLGDKVKFTGFVKYDDIYKYYKVADICSFPSTWEEPFALTCLEAIVCGKPVVITKSGGMPEIVNEHCALVVANDNLLADNLAKVFVGLFKDPKKINLMAKAALERAKIFSPQNQYRRFVNLINIYVHE